MKEESHAPIWDVGSLEVTPPSWPDNVLLFATAHTDRVYLYKAFGGQLAEKLHELVLDASEDLYAVSPISLDTETGNMLIAAGGKCGTLHIWSIDPSGHATLQSLIDNGDDIYHLAWHPARPWHIFVGNRDSTVRLYNGRTGHQVARFMGGSFAVYALSVHPSGALLCAGGTDNAIRVFDLTENRLIQAITDSDSYDAEIERRPFPTVDVACPIFATQAPHGDYIDSIGFVAPLTLMPPFPPERTGVELLQSGKVLLLTKAADGNENEKERMTHRLILWRPRLGWRDPDAVQVIKEMDVKTECSEFFIKFGLFCEAVPVAQPQGSSSSSAVDTLMRVKIALGYSGAHGCRPGTICVWEIDQAREMEKAAEPPASLSPWAPAQRRATTTGPGGRATAPSEFYPLEPSSYSIRPKVSLDAPDQYISTSPAIRRVVFSPNGKSMVAVTHGGLIYIWDFEDR